LNLLILPQRETHKYILSVPHNASFKQKRPFAEREEGGERGKGPGTGAGGIPWCVVVQNDLALRIRSSRPKEERKGGGEKKKPKKKRKEGEASHPRLSYQTQERQKEGKGGSTEERRGKRGGQIHNELFCFHIQGARHHEKFKRGKKEEEGCSLPNF